MKGKYMNNELQLRTGPYRTTFTGTEITRASTPDEWQNYGETLKRIDEAKQWAIGDWLVDGKAHYGDRLYEKAARILEIPRNTLEHYKSQSERFKLCTRVQNLSWAHHREVVSLKKTHRPDTGKWKVSGDPDENKRPESVFFANRTEHSEKPDIVYELIEQMYPEYNKLEMFSRKERNGWDSWGDETFRIYEQRQNKNQRMGGKASVLRLHRICDP